jgi:3-deoxy-manno-octulosonate cytidylyltransferase (CMP-KDO synthetase)
MLLPLAGKPLVQWTWEAACRTAADEVIVAVDDAETLAVCRGFGADARMTDPILTSGTDRVDQIAREAGWGENALIVNLQGDEPLMPPALVNGVAELLAGDELAEIATLAYAIHDREEFLDPNVVKVVTAHNGYALYFSRAPIPWRRQGTSRETPLPVGLAMRHVGLYGYRVSALARLASLPPAPLETCESLEQLRALAHGMRIRVGIVDEPPPRGIDTAADLEAAEQRLAAGTFPHG